MSSLDRMPSQILRIIDAGMNRIGEALRAIGGINMDNVAKVIAAGVDSDLIISADNPEEAARQIVERHEVNSGQTDK
ncbi:MAG TPA: hypothetical protein VMW13_01220 [Dehalococcoidales bacterium]|nr:hypothetical protein [Dehalococcoidales bacterium]